jgi:hypothetical protein
VAERPIAPVLKTGSVDSESSAPSTVATNAGSVLPSGLPESVEIAPELARLVARWSDLPEHVRLAILTLADSVR